MDDISAASLRNWKKQTAKVVLLLFFSLFLKRERKSLRERTDEWRQLKGKRSDAFRFASHRPFFSLSPLSFSSPVVCVCVCVCGEPRRKGRISSTWSIRFDPDLAVGGGPSLRLFSGAWAWAWTRVMALALLRDKWRANWMPPPTPPTVCLPACLHLASVPLNYYSALPANFAYWTILARSLKGIIVSFLSFLLLLSSSPCCFCCCWDVYKYRPTDPTRPDRSSLCLNQPTSHQPAPLNWALTDAGGWWWSPPDPTGFLSSLLFPLRIHTAEEKRREERQRRLVDLFSFPVWEFPQTPLFFFCCTRTAKRMFCCSPFAAAAAAESSCDRSDDHSTRRVSLLLARCVCGAHRIKSSFLHSSHRKRRWKNRLALCVVGEDEKEGEK